MPGLSVPEAAAEMGVSDVRVRQLISAGRIDAERIGGRWVVDPASLRRSAPSAVRPMSSRVAWAMLLDPEPDKQWLRPDEASRLRARRNRLVHSDDPLSLLRSWTSRRAQDRHMHAQDTAELLADPRVVPSGLSDSRSGMSAAGFAEGYVQVESADELVEDHLLVPASRARANVLLHVSPILPPNPVPDLIVIADLASSNGPREEGRAQELISHWLVEVKKAQRKPIDVECHHAAREEWAATLKKLEYHLHADPACAERPNQERLAQDLISKLLIVVKKAERKPKDLACSRTASDDWVAATEALKSRIDGCDPGDHSSKANAAMLSETMERLLAARREDLAHGPAIHGCGVPVDADWESAIKWAKGRL